MKVIISGYGRMGHMVEKELARRGIELVAASEDICSVDPAVAKECVVAIGYGGVVVYIDINGKYNAWDLACPYCAARGKRSPCTISGIMAHCHECDEQYDIGSGTAAPQRGVAKEYLLRIPVLDNDGKLTIRQ